ncbi:Rrf2 family transcriptional regulator [Carboxylicivirga caseinilyticus]|uniref:RrF2 family transcriptional regulator n=1 Tax=Carboxylicivirga caseinilyticus TaxID=3417572 RepID=UPI002AA7018C|nr:Rrf2 family transcriptional regulator [uncultured Carboxylicivirga sp.]MCU4164911.1 Rrf2 family transcriptional regulator [Marinilabiliaceae bacterium A049]
MSKIVTLSEAASIALHSMVLIARSEVKLNVNQISEAIESSKHHVAKVMQRLAKEDFVSSNRGPSGGFVLKCDPEKLSLLQIYEAIEGKIAIHSCPGDKRTCVIGSCMLGDLAKTMTREFKNYMESHFLSEYIN